MGLDGKRRVLLTDHPWPDVEIERRIFEDAGLELVAGPVTAPSAAVVDEMVADADPVAIMTCWAEVNSSAISRPGRLQVVARLGIGLDNIDVEAATARGAWVTNVPDYCIGEVADHAVGLVLAHYRGLVALDRAAKNGDWAPERAELRRVADLTVGLIGYGKIGRATAERLKVFGCRVLAHSPSYRLEEGGVEPANLAQLQSDADVIILHAPLTARTKHIVNLKFLEGCARRPLIVNVSRGPLVDNDALTEALARGLISGAGLDVIEGEPTPPQGLIRDERIIVTPHVAFSSDAAISELRRRACEDVVRVLAGQAPSCPCNNPGEPLTGGVSSDVRLVSSEGGRTVVKRALTKLKVEADWYSDPSRSMIEVAALRNARGLLGVDAVPEVLWADASSNSFAMNYLQPPFETWKARLMRGVAERDVAKSAGTLLGRLHRKSRSNSELQSLFGDTQNFEELRIEPFFDRTALAEPDLAPYIRAAAEGMRSQRSALVHGDYSPKNILTDGSRVVIIDWEVAHWGDPRFDVAFCLAHLILKLHRASSDKISIDATASAFADAYRLENPGVWDRALVALTGALVLTRLVGPSPVEYGAELEREAAHAMASDMLRGQIDQLTLSFFMNMESSNAVQPV